MSSQRTEPHDGERNETTQYIPMSSTSIRDALTYRDGQEIMEITGTVHAIHTRRSSAPGASNAWSVQHVVLIENGATLKFELWDRPELPKSFQGSIMKLEATMNAKKRWSGLLIKPHTPEGKPPEQRVKVTNFARLLFNGVPWEAGASQPSAPAHTAPSEPQHRAPAPSAPPQQHNAREAAPEREAAPSQQPTQPVDADREMKRKVVGVSKQIARMGNAMKLCIQRAEAVATWHHEYSARGKWTAGEIKELATTFFIELHKQGGAGGLPDSTDVETILPSLKRNEASAQG